MAKKRLADLLREEAQKVPKQEIESAPPSAEGGADLPKPKEDGTAPSPVEELEAAIAELKAAKESAMEKEALQQQQIAELQSSLEEQKTRTGELETQLEQANSQNTKLQADLQKHQSDLALVRAELEKSQQHNQKLEGKLAKQQADMSERETILQNLKADLKKSNRLNNKLEEAKAEQQENIEKLKTRAIELEEELQSAKEAATQLAAANEKLVAEANEEAQEKLASQKLAIQRARPTSRFEPIVKGTDLSDDQLGWFD